MLLVYNCKRGDDVKKIIILNGATRKSGNTAKLIKAFTDDANAAGNTVREFYLADMNIHGCAGCERCGNTKRCAQSDDMREIYEAFEQAKIIPNFYNEIGGSTGSARGQSRRFGRSHRS